MGKSRGLGSIPLPGNATQSDVSLFPCNSDKDKGAEEKGGGLPENTAPHPHPHLRERSTGHNYSPGQTPLGRTSLALSNGEMSSFQDLQG